MPSFFLTLHKIVFSEKKHITWHSWGFGNTRCCWITVCIKQNTWIFTVILPEQNKKVPEFHCISGHYYYTVCPSFLSYTDPWCLVKHKYLVVAQCFCIFRNMGIIWVKLSSLVLFIQAWHKVSTVFCLLSPPFSIVIFVCLEKPLPSNCQHFLHSPPVHCCSFCIAESWGGSQCCDLSVVGWSL